MTMLTLNKTLIVNRDIRGVLSPSGRWALLPAAEWNFLLRISGPKWKTARLTARNRKRAQRLRRRIGMRRVELVRGIGYRLGRP